MKVVSLQSGSKGNTTLVCSTKFRLLIDVGGSMKSINDKLMMSEGIDLEDINYILITHAHTDHCNALNTILNKYQNIKVLTTKDVYSEVNEFHKGKLDVGRFVLTSIGTQDGNTFSLTVFNLNHDKQCVGFMINDYNETYVHIADNGSFWDKELIEQLSNKDYYNIESNYDVELTYFDEKRQPMLKRRCLGFTGHSSNIEAISLALRLVGSNTKCVMFNHLSEETNSEAIAIKWHMKHLEIWNKLEDTKHILFSYALQHDIVDITSGRTHKEIRGVR